MTTFTASALAAPLPARLQSCGLRAPVIRRGYAEADRGVLTLASRAGGAGEADLSPEDWNRTEPATPGAAARWELP